MSFRGHEACQYLSRICPGPTILEARKGRTPSSDELQSRNPGRDQQTLQKKTLQNLTGLRAIALLETGSADVAFSRCRALSWTCEKLRE
jgi:hypothetical protein